MTPAPVSEATARERERRAFAAGARWATHLGPHAADADAPAAAQDRYPDPEDTR